MGTPIQSGQGRTVRDSYRRLIQRFDPTVTGVDGDLFEQAMAAHRTRGEARSDHDLGTGELVLITKEFKDIIRKETGDDFFRDPPNSSPAPSAARVYRRRERSPTTAARPSTSRPRSSATSATAPTPASPSPATPPPRRRCALLAGRGGRHCRPRAAGAARRAESGEPAISH
ncbi:hypothetical protein AB0G67_30750 [Streptomyces sp. NPDC021056]|uniref:hypothetical protein n=1 Tax=Streptomyces sp. NPDC021056 TaxID=3155012 RepID=UPI00340C7DC0